MDFLQLSTISTLSDLVCDCPNFKVRIKAAMALSCVPEKCHYGQSFSLVWNSLVKALENSQIVGDFNEYKHRDHLIDQVIYTFLKLHYSSFSQCVFGGKISGGRGKF